MGQDYAIFFICNILYNFYGENDNESFGEKCNLPPDADEKVATKVSGIFFMARLMQD